jgi:predicted NBD/HSP70 family sugar kinase
MESAAKLPFDHTRFPYLQETNMHQSPRVTVVIDVGGTTTRAARFTDDHIDKTVLCPTPTVLLAPGATVDALQQQLVHVLGEVIHAVTGDLPLAFAGRPMPVAISFSGRVDAAGRSVISAPDIWGTWATVFDLAGELEARMQSAIEVRLCSDVVSAAWRYEQQSLQEHSFALVMARTGISYALCDPSAIAESEPVLLGHMPVSDMTESFRCSCGAMDHVSAFATGAGVVNVVMKSALDDPKSFRASALFESAARRHDELTANRRSVVLRRHAVLHNIHRFIDVDVWRDMNDVHAELTPAELQRWMLPALLDAGMFIDAVRRSDAFALRLLDDVTRPVAAHLRDHVFGHVDVVALAGGFARALGDEYRRRIAPGNSSTAVLWAQDDDLGDLRATKQLLWSEATIDLRDSPNFATPGRGDLREPGVEVLPA